MAEHNPDDCTPVEQLQMRFLVMQPRIELHGRITFRAVRCPHARADAIAEMIALSWLWYLRLARQGKDATLFVSALATFAARAVRSGRRLCGQERAKEVLSPLAQRRHGFMVEKLPDYTTLGGNLLDEALRDNTRSAPDEQAAFRIEFPLWLSQFGPRHRRIALDMALGHGTLDLAHFHGCSAARISQLRREYHQDWQHFTNEEPGNRPTNLPDPDPGLLGSVGM